MPRRRKHPNLPNGFGTIRYLGEKRRNPYAVHPPTKEFNLNGTPVRPQALCYVDDWYKGFAVLTAYKAGGYYPGYECEWHNKNIHFYRRKFPTSLCLKASYRYTESVTKILRLRRDNNYAGGRYENNDSNVIQERV